MISFSITELIVPPMIIGLIPATIAKKKGRSFMLWWLYGAALFIIAIIHSILLKKNDDALLSEGMKKCPHCAEFIRPDAKVCRYCSRDVAQ